MRENFKLRKMKVGLVSVAITMLYIMTNGQADASETSKTAGNQKVNTIQETKDVAQPVQNNKEANSDETKKNFVTLDSIKPGDQKVTGTTLPNHYVLLTVDGKVQIQLKTVILDWLKQMKMEDLSIHYTIEKLFITKKL